MTGFRFDEYERLHRQLDDLLVRVGHAFTPQNASGQFDGERPLAMLEMVDDGDGVWRWRERPRLPDQRAALRLLAEERFGATFAMHGDAFSTIIV